MGKKSAKAKKSPREASKQAKKKPVKKARKIVAAKATRKTSVQKSALKKRPAAKKASKKPAKKLPARKAAPRKAPGQTTTKLVAQAAVKRSYEGAVADQVNAIIAVLEDAKAEDIVAIDLTGRSTMADAMVVATGRVNRHVAAIAEQLLSKLKNRGVKNIRVEGLEAGDWCLVDTGDVIIHIFRPEVRVFYNLEKLWSIDAPKEHQ